MQDLNQTRIHSLRYPEGLPLEDYCTEAEGLVVYFRALRERLIQYINTADIVIGSVAWLTEPKILEALADAEAVGILIQKRDLFRKDLGDGVDHRHRLTIAYERLPDGLTRADVAFKETALYCKEPYYKIEPIRVVGYNQKSSVPKAHNKFVIFCRRIGQSFEPYGVWTGSFNFTKTSTFSFENALYITQPEIVKAYFYEYAQLQLLSEPMYAMGDTVQPQWRKEND